MATFLKRGNPDILASDSKSDFGPWTTSSLPFACFRAAQNGYREWSLDHCQHSDSYRYRFWLARHLHDLQEPDRAVGTALWPPKPGARFAVTSASPYPGSGSGSLQQILGRGPGHGLAIPTIAGGAGFPMARWLGKSRRPGSPEETKSKCGFAAWRNSADSPQPFWAADGSARMTRQVPPHWTSDEGPV